jgi:hypothetical protein
LYVSEIATYDEEGRGFIPRTIGVTRRVEANICPTFFPPKIRYLATQLKLDK